MSMIAYMPMVLIELNREDVHCVVLELDRQRKGQIYIQPTL